MIIITERSDVDSLECDLPTTERLKSLQQKLIGLMEAGACSQFSLECGVSGKTQKVAVRSSGSLGFFEKIFKKVV
jgi:hypothetical protein